MMNAEYLARRFGQGVVTVAIVVTITFTIARMLPGSGWVIQCIGQGAGAGQCQPPATAETAAGIPPGELAVMAALVVALFLVSAYIVRE